MFITLIAASSNINFMRQFSSVEVLFQAEIKSYMLCSDVQNKLCGRDWENSIDLMFFILELSNHEEYQYMVDILTLNATQYFSNGIVYENINECVANIGGKEEVHLDFSMLSKHELFGFVDSLYKIAGKETKLSPNLSLLLSEYYSDILAFKMCHIGAYRTLCNEVHLAWKMWVQFGYANGKRIRDIEKSLCESADVGFLTSYCNSIKAVPDTVLSMVGGKRGIDSIQYKKLIELKDKL